MLHGSWETRDLKWLLKGHFGASFLKEDRKNILSKGFNSLKLKEWTWGVIQQRDPLSVWYVHMDIDCRCKLWPGDGKHCVLFCLRSSFCRQLSWTLEQRIESTLDYWKLNWERGQCGKQSLKAKWIHLLWLLNTTYHIFFYFFQSTSNYLTFCVYLDEASFSHGMYSSWGQGPSIYFSVLYYLTPCWH